MINKQSFQDSYTKSIFILTGVLLAGFLLVKSAEAVRNLSAPDPMRPAITISGEGKIFIKPDIGQVSLSVISEATTVKDAQDKATAAINNVMKSLKDSGIADKDIKTTGYNVIPKYEFDRGGVETDMIVPPSGSPRISGYTVSQNLQVKIRDLSKAGDILANAAAAGANQVDGLTFTTENPETVQAEARTRAIEDARVKARELERKLGINLGKIIGFSESGGPYQIYRDYAIGKGTEAAQTPSPEITVGENEVIVNVNITYQIN